MTINFPEGLRWVGEALGLGDFPKGDEDKLRLLGEAWTVTGQQLDGLAGDIASARDSVRSGLQGATADQFTSYITQVSSAVGPIAESAGQLGQSCQAVAVEIEYAKLMYIFTLAWLAVEITMLIDSLFGAPAVPAVEAAGQFTIEQIMKQLLKAVAREVGVQVGISGAVQVIQWAKHERKGLDFKILGEAAATGAVAGATGVAFHAGVHFLPPGLTRNAFGEVVTSAVIGATQAGVVMGINDAMFGVDPSQVGFGILAGGLFGGGASAGGRLLRKPPPEDTVALPDLHGLPRLDVAVPQLDVAVPPVHDTMPQAGGTAPRPVDEVNVGERPATLIAEPQASTPHLATVPEPLGGTASLAGGKVSGMDGTGGGRFAQEVVSGAPGQPSALQGHAGEQPAGTQRLPSPDAAHDPAVLAPYAEPADVGAATAATAGTVSGTVRPTDNPASAPPATSNAGVPATERPTEALLTSAAPPGAIDAARRAAIDTVSGHALREPPGVNPVSSLDKIGNATAPPVIHPAAHPAPEDRRAAGGSSLAQAPPVQRLPLETASRPPDPPHTADSSRPPGPSFIADPDTPRPPRGGAGEFAPSPSYAPHDDPRVAQWSDAQRRLNDVYDQRLTDEATRAAHAARIEQRVNGAFDAWKAGRGDGLSADVLAGVQGRAHEMLDRRLDPEGQHSDEVFAGLGEDLDIALAREMANVNGRQHFDQVFSEWLGSRQGQGEPRFPLDLSAEPVAAVREHMSTVWSDRVGAQAERLFATHADVTTHLAARVEQAGDRLTRLGEGFRNDLDLRAAYQTVHRQGLNAVGRAGESWHEDLGAEDRRMLDELGVPGGPLSQPSIAAVANRHADRLREDFTEVFGSTDSAAEFRGDLPGALSRWSERQRTHDAGLADDLATQAIREWSITRIVDAVEHAATTFTEGLTRLGPGFTETFGLAGHTLTDHDLNQVKARLASQADAAAQRFRDPTPPAGDDTARPAGPGATEAGSSAERLAQLTRTLDDLTRPGTLHDHIGVAAARERTVTRAARDAAAVAAAWQARYPGRPLTHTATERITTGYTGRISAAFDSLFRPGASAEDLPRRLADWGRQRHDLGADLPAHVAFESEAGPALAHAGRAYRGLSEGRGLDEGTLEQTGSDYRTDWFTGYKQAWKPDLSADGWLSHEHAQEDAFTAASGGNNVETRLVQRSGDTVSGDGRKLTAQEYVRDLLPEQDPRNGLPIADLVKVPEPDWVRSAFRQEPQEHATVVTPAARIETGDPRVPPLDGHLVSEVNRELRRLTPGASPVSQDEVRPVRQQLSATSPPRLTSRAAGEQIAQIMTTGSRARLRGGGSGIEVEFTELADVHESAAAAASAAAGGDEQAVSASSVRPQVLVDMPYDAAQLTVETKDFYQGPDGEFHRTVAGAQEAGGTGDPMEMAIPEFVNSEVMAVLPGEENRADPNAVFHGLSQVEQALGGLDTVGGPRGGEPSVPLSQVFPPGGAARFDVTGLGERTLIGPRSIGDGPGAHVHHTIGVPIAGLYPFLRHVEQRTWRVLAGGYHTRAHLAQGLAFGDELAFRFLFPGRPLPADPAVVAQAVDARGQTREAAELRGYAALLYQNAAMVAHGPAYEGLAKAQAAVLSRNDMADILNALPPRVQAFLGQSTGGILHSFRERFLATVGDYYQRYQETSGRPPLQDFLDHDGEYLLDRHTIRDYLESGLIAGHPRRIGQADVVTTTVLSGLDTNGGRLPIPLVVMEVRSYEARHVDAATAWQHHLTLQDEARSVYYDAMVLHNPARHQAYLGQAPHATAEAMPGLRADSVVAARYPWLGDVNPYRGTDEQFATNCLLTAIATDMSLDTGHPHQAGASDLSPADYLVNFADGRPIYEVPSYQAVVSALEDAPIGSRAMVVVGLDGAGIAHVFNAVRDEHGVVFLDGQRGAQADLSAVPQSLRFIPAGEAPVTLQATGSGERPALDGVLGGSGIEVEFTEIADVYESAADAASAVAGGDEQPVSAGAVRPQALIDMPGNAAQVTVETKDFYPDEDGRLHRTAAGAQQAGGTGDAMEMAIPEFVSAIMRGLPGEYNRADPDAVRQALIQVEQRLGTIEGQRGSMPGVPLSDVFLPGGHVGFDVTELGQRTLIGPRSIGDGPGAHVHHTIGVPIAGLHPFLRHVEQRTWRDQSLGYHTRAHLAQGLAFGDELAFRFLYPRDELPTDPAGQADPARLAQLLDTRGRTRDAAELRGYGALLYQNAAMVAQGPAYDGLPKVHAAVLSRNDMADILSALSTPARTFLEQGTGGILASFRERFMATVPDYHERYQQTSGRPPLPDFLDHDGEFRLDRHTIRDYLNSGLIVGAPRISQADVVTTTPVHGLDTNGGRLEIPLVVMEIRSYEARHVNASTAWEHHLRLMLQARAAYDRARHLHNA